MDWNGSFWMRAIQPICFLLWIIFHLILRILIFGYTLCTTYTHTHATYISIFSRFAEIFRFLIFSARMAIFRCKFHRERERTQSFILRDDFFILFSFFSLNMKKKKHFLMNESDIVNMMPVYVMIVWNIEMLLWISNRKFSYPIHTHKKNTKYIYRWG